MPRAIALLLLILPSLAAADEVKIEGERAVPAHSLVKLKAANVDPKAGIIWRVYPPQNISKADTSKDRLQFAAPPGRYSVELLAVRLSPDGTTEISEAAEQVTIGKANPDEPPEPPPGPPDEKPPIEAAGFRVMVVYEKSELLRLTPGQHSILYGEAVRDYLRRKCVVGEDGKTPECRFYDKDVQIEFEASHWKKAMQRPRGSLPWMIVSNGKTGWEGPLPESPEKAMEILKKYGGE